MKKSFGILCVIVLPLASKIYSSDGGIYAQPVYMPGESEPYYRIRPEDAAKITNFQPIYLPGFTGPFYRKPATTSHANWGSPPASPSVTENTAPSNDINSNDPYKVLGVPRTATKAEITKAFKKLSLRYHPDKGGTTEDFQKLNSAYTALQ